MALKQLGRRNVDPERVTDRARELGARDEHGSDVLVCAHASHHDLKIQVARQKLTSYSGLEL